MDDVAPYFKTEPGLPQIHLEGNRLVLTCLAEGSWPLEFKWIHNDSEITAYSAEYKYIIPSLQRFDAGFYQCVVRNRMGALLQRKSEVQVAYMGNFMDTDQRKTVSQGEAAILNFLHITSYPRPQVTWFRDGHKIIPTYMLTLTSFSGHVKPSYLAKHLVGRDRLVGYIYLFIYLFKFMCHPSY
uniref:Ig-like domain-containing protein n=1 Tax=Sphenodon punctatus TaxID=8508 RepID=A0A8D0G4E9_SPHPU